MPIVEFHLLEGRSPELKRELARRVTDTICEVLGSRQESVRILIHQLAADDFSVGGVTMAEREQQGVAANGHAPASVLQGVKG